MQNGDSTKPRDPTWRFHNISLIKQNNTLVHMVNHTLLLIRVCQDFLQIWDQSVQPPQTQVWTPPSLSRQWLVRVINHTLLQIQGMSGFWDSTNVRWIGYILTHTIVSTTKSFSAATRVRSKSHTTPHMRFVKILYKHQISEINPCRRTSEHYRVLFGCDSCA